MGAAEEKLRVDKWLWQARFFRSRGRAGEVAGSGGLRVNGSHVSKPSHPVRPGDVLTFAQGRLIRVIRVEALGTRRGPASEAATLYSDLEPPSAAGAAMASDPAPVPQREPGQGRPTKRERRRIDVFRRPPP